MPLVMVRLSDLTEAARAACLALSEALVPLAARTGSLGVELDVRRAWVAGSLLDLAQCPNERLVLALDVAEKIRGRYPSVRGTTALSRENAPPGEGWAEQQARCDAQEAVHEAAEAAVKALCAVVDYWRAAGALGGG